MKLFCDILYYFPLLFVSRPRMCELPIIRPDIDKNPRFLQTQMLLPIFISSYINFVKYFLVPYIYTEQKCAMYYNFNNDDLTAVPSRETS